MKITLRVNGRNYTRETAPDRALLRFLREDLGLTGTKEGCGAGECGACTVLLNGRPVNSCLVLAAECDGAEVETIESLAASGSLNRLQQALLDNAAVQCGYCTPGMLMTLTAFLREHPKPTEAECFEAIEGNFCRCTGYRQIVDAALDAAGVPRKKEGLKNA